MASPAWAYFRRLFRGDSLRIVMSVCLTVGRSLVVFLSLLLVRRTIDRLKPGEGWESIVLTGSGILLLMGLNLWLVLRSKALTLRTTGAALQRLREDLITKVYALSRSWHTQADRSRLHTVLVQDTARVEEMSVALIGQLLPAVVISLPLVVFLVYINWVLFLIMLAAFPLIYLVNKKIGEKVKNRVRDNRESTVRLNRGIWFVLWMADLTKYQAAEDEEIGRQKESFRDYRKTLTDMSWLQTAYNTVQEVMADGSGIVVLIIGGIAISRGALTAGELVSFYVGALLLKRNMAPFLASLSGLITGKESLAAVHELLASEALAPYQGSEDLDFRGGIALRSIGFRYKEAPVLSGLDLAIPPGATVSVVGPNGSGKTTLAHLILGLYRPQEGAVLAEGRPYDVLNIGGLRRRIGFLPQDPFLFPGSILANITYGSPRMGLEDVREAARIATADDFIMGLPEGYETHVGESGVLLSGGERQKIALTRALLRRPPLLILDEPTNHLDKDSVAKLLENLKSLSQRPSVLIITHEEAVAREAQFPYLLEGGKLRPAPKESCPGEGDRISGPKTDSDGGQR